ncbi:transcriptional regulator, TetR family [Natronincola peptidivorans]|uniref:Transcriptional regulator, TetR family n=1 Tax=Natronincola peptidivorans TaxID=426128 RepID=A0A1I0C6K5_9FIRM|nr:TetR/AcrR family transcriptional regulator [Natronincola peptidivorans]SET15135.1 transcriptional regulator, TetR family [Natronincola peptidivorans]
MARITDPQKIENVKRAVMEIIVDHGYSALSIDAIAKKAKVSGGYLYRHYNSKEELLEDTFETSFLKFQEEVGRIFTFSSNFYEFVSNFVNMVFELTIEDSIYSQMIATILIDKNMEKIMEDDEISFFHESLDKLLHLGKKTGEINPQTTREEMILVIMVIPFSYVIWKAQDPQYEAYFQKEHAEGIIRLCVNALK